MKVTNKLRSNDFQLALPGGLEGVDENKALKFEEKGKELLLEMKTFTQNQ